MGDYILDTDASGIAIGGVLSQVQNGTERITVRTNHQTLVWLFKLKEPKRRIVCWLDIFLTLLFQLNIAQVLSIGMRIL